MNKMNNLLRNQSAQEISFLLPAGRLSFYGWYFACLHIPAKVAQVFMNYIFKYRIQQTTNSFARLAKRCMIGKSCMDFCFIVACIPEFNFSCVPYQRTRQGLPAE